MFVEVSSSLRREESFKSVVSVPTRGPLVRIHTSGSETIKSAQDIVSGSA
jgi:hypothetical protein